MQGATKRAIFKLLLAGLMIIQIVASIWTLYWIDSHREQTQGHIIFVAVWVVSWPLLMFSFLILGFIVVSTVPQMIISAFDLKGEADKSDEHRREIIKTINKENYFERITEITFSYIESYYKQTQTQANRSFWFSAIAAALSFIILCGGVAKLYIDPTPSMGAAITVSAGAFGEFISAVFFFLYNRTVLKMSEYHQKLVITQNVVMAANMTETVVGDQYGKERFEARLLLVRSLTKNINKYLSPTPDRESAPPRRTRKQQAGT